MPPQDQELRSLAQERDLNPDAFEDDDELRAALEATGGVDTTGGDDESADDAQPGVDGVTPIPVDAASRPAGPTAPAPTPADQPGVGRTANQTTSALPESLAKQHERTRERGQRD